MNYKELEKRNIDAFGSALIVRIEEICEQETTALSQRAIHSGVAPSTLYDFKKDDHSEFNHDQKIMRRYQNTPVGICRFRFVQRHKF